MKGIKIILSLAIGAAVVFSCKSNPVKKEEVNSTTVDSLVQDVETPIMETESLYLKGNDLKVIPIKEVKDDAVEAQEYLESRRFRKETEGYIIDFCYPYLKESINPKFKLFNQYVMNDLLKLPEIEKSIIESQELLCDTSNVTLNTEHRVADYKVFLQNKKELSVLFYLENHYTNTKATYYTFKTVNFDIEKGKLLNFDDFFAVEDSEEVLDIVNMEISTSIRNGDMFYECFTVSKEDFEKAKNDFVFKNKSIIFYFNDCVMCPAFVGTYEIEIPLERFKPILKKEIIEELAI
ncbi:RsiV family protein [Tenacibaculum sp. MEBiC06402]|uniref:RsiV family protein n=1 Tax=unclassified Tenacibaculum TaxID=2635139 RepID=UPI003B9AF1C3